MTTWAERAREGNLTVKGKRATPAQAHNMALIVAGGRRLGARGQNGVEAIAGAVATSIQESGLSRTAQNGEHVGLFQQSNAYGSYAQRTDPEFAIKQFYTREGYLKAVMDGTAWAVASDNTQRSGRPDEPRQWYAEAVRGTRYFLNQRDLADATGSNRTGRRSGKYEFSRGSADSPENSWDCLGRLATEVAWVRFMRGGTLWFASQEWLAEQRPRYRLGEFSGGVLGCDFGFDTRRKAEEASLRVVARRYQIGPGDCIELLRQGPGSGIWLVSSVRKTLSSPVAEVALRRPAQKLPEPKVAEGESVRVGDRSQRRGGSEGESAGARAMVRWAEGTLGSREGGTRHARWAKWSGVYDPWCGVWLGYGMKFVAHLEPPSGYPDVTSWLSWNHGRRVGLSDIQAGDAVAFDWGDGGDQDHVALYVGNGNVIGGNQSDNVTRVAFNRDACVAVVRPDYRG